MPDHGTRSGARVAHEDSDCEERGASGSLRLARGGPTELSFGLAPTWNATASGVEKLWSAHDARRLAPGGEFTLQNRPAGRFGFGMGLDRVGSRPPFS